MFIGGAVVQWLRDGLGLIAKSVDVEKLAASVPTTAASTSCPRSPDSARRTGTARGAIVGLTRGTTAAHSPAPRSKASPIRAPTCSAPWRRTAVGRLRGLRVDGGATVNNALMQFQADLLRVPVVRPRTTETTALGAAYLAGLAVGFWKNPADIARQWQVDKRFKPAMKTAARTKITKGWERVEPSEGVGRVVAAGVLIAIAAAQGSAQSPSQRTYANPIDIDYRYNFEQHNEGISYRSGADPVIVVQRGEYYLFETIGDGYWHSRDLGTWQHITPSRWPLTDIVAPAVLSVRDTIYCPAEHDESAADPDAHRKPGTPGASTTLNRRAASAADGARPDEVGLNAFAKPDSVQPGPWDPQFFHDPDTERWFLYWNSSNVYPLNVIEEARQNEAARVHGYATRWLFGRGPR